MKTTITSIIIAVVLIGGSFILSQGGFSQTDIPANNVSIVDGKQIIQINARGGYQPRNSIAKSGIPTIIRFNTNGTFDCSSSVRIPSMNISRILPQTGTTDIEIGSQNVATLQGTCGMGMYPFSVRFQ